MKQQVITVEQALKWGNFLLRICPVIVMIVLMLGGVLLVSSKLAPRWVAMVGVPLSFVAGWVWWSIATTHWRLWALEHVRNIHDLFTQAEQDGLIYRKGSLFERMEIRTRPQRERMEALEMRFDVPDEHTDDPTVPEVTCIRYSPLQLWISFVMGLFATGLGIYMMASGHSLAFGGILVIGGGVWLRQDLRRLLEKHPPVILNEHGITLRGRLITWDDVVREEVVRRGSGRTKNRTVLNVYHAAGQEELDLGVLPIDMHKLRQLMRTYRARHEALRARS